MRKVLIYLTVLMSAALAVPAADARPVAVAVVVPGVQLAQYHGYEGYRGNGWERHREWRRHEAWARFHRHEEWRRHREFRHW